MAGVGGRKIHPSVPARKRSGSPGAATADSGNSMLPAQVTLPATTTAPPANFRSSRRLKGCFKIIPVSPLGSFVALFDEWFMGSPEHRMHPRPGYCLLYTSPSPRDGLLSR